MQRSKPKLHLFGDRIADEKKRVEDQIAKSPPWPERDRLLKKARQLDTASHLNEWLASSGLQTPQ